MEITLKNALKSAIDENEKVFILLNIFVIIIINLFLIYKIIILNYFI